MREGLIPRPLLPGEVNLIALRSLWEMNLIPRPGSKNLIPRPLLPGEKGRKNLVKNDLGMGRWLKNENFGK